MLTRSRFALGLGAGILISATAAEAYVRMRTPDGVALAWRGGCPSLTLEAAGGDQLATEDVIADLTAAREAWRTGAAACAGLPVEIIARAAAARIDYDGVDEVLWRDADHCLREGTELDEICLSPNAAAVTTVFFHEQGEIVETDVEINGAISFGRAGEPDRIDLRSVVTHELGHAMGLEHTCETVPGRAPLLDSLGVPIPPCSPQIGVPESARAATMYPYVLPGELTARTPLDEELAGVCALYRDHADSCADTGPGCGCRAGGGGPGGLVLAALAALVLLRTWLRSRR